MALNSLTFNGTSSKVALPSISGLSAGFTFGCWFRAFAASTSSAQGLVCNATGTNDRASLCIVGQTPYMFVSGAYYNGAFQGAKSSNAALQLGKWNHVVYTYNGAAGALYVNGAPQSGVTTPSTGSTAAATIGCRNDSANFLTGRMDQVSIYKRALTPREVMGMYEFGIIPANPYGRYPLDDGHGATAFDWSSNRNNGTITAGQWSREQPIRLMTRQLRNRRRAGVP